MASHQIRTTLKLLNSGDLVIFDLGYSKKEALFDISDAGAYFVSRLNHQLGLYREDEKGQLTKFDLAQKLQKEEKKGTKGCEFAVCVSEGDRRLQVRVVPEAVANERRRKIRDKAKKKGYTPSARYLYLQGWSLYITNAGVEILANQLAQYTGYAGR